MLLGLPMYFLVTDPPFSHSLPTKNPLLLKYVYELDPGKLAHVCKLGCVVFVRPKEQRASNPSATQQFGHVFGTRSCIFGVNRQYVDELCAHPVSVPHHSDPRHFF